MLRAVRASRYVLPFREGGSVPALVEADDDGMYVVKLRGAGQGAKSLVAELVAGELARAAGLAVPEIVKVDIDRAIADAEPDPELAVPLEASVGVNVGLDYLPGSITFDPVADPPPDARTASRIVLFDAFAMNVDRTARNPNLLFWHGRLWLIDHGACLYVHHGWTGAGPLEGSQDPFVEIKDHVLLKWASALDEAAGDLGRAFEDDVLSRVVAEIPASWGENYAPYVGWLRARRDAMNVYLEEAGRARAMLV
jgi:HipA-like kinase